MEKKGAQQWCATGRPLSVTHIAVYQPSIRVQMCAEQQLWLQTTTFILAAENF